MERRLRETPVAANTVTGREANIARFRAHWLRGRFESFPARACTTDVIVELREHLLHRARWKRRFEKTKSHCRFKVPVGNQTLWVLRVMLDIGVEKLVLIANPFRTSTIPRGSLFAKERSRSGRGGGPLQLPSRETMNRIFAEMRRLPDGPEFNPNPEQRRTLQEDAHEVEDLAELLAYSGMRKSEALSATLADDLGEEFKIWGTESESSDRTIPVNPALRAVLDRIKSRRIGGATKLVKFSEPRTALHRACERLGLPKLRNHDLRHYFAPVCIGSGVHVPTVARWLGHADGGALAMKVYGDVMRDLGAAAAGKWISGDRIYRLRPMEASKEARVTRHFATPGTVPTTSWERTLASSSRRKTSPNANPKPSLSLRSAITRPPMSAGMCGRMAAFSGWRA